MLFNRDISHSDRSKSIPLTHRYLLPFSLMSIRVEFPYRKRTAHRWSP
jgi:hypothetical protein